MTRDEPEAHPIIDPRFLVALVALVVNDHWAKETFPGLITGKLSDFAGMIVLPVLLASVVALVPRLHGRIDNRRVTTVSIALSGTLLVAIKTSAVAAGLTESALETITRQPQHIVVDPTDLVGLIALILVHRILVAPIPFPTFHARRWARNVGIALALGACMATSVDEPRALDDLQIQGDGTLVLSTHSDGWTGARVSDDGGETWRWEATEPDAELSGLDTGPVCLAGDQQICVRAITAGFEESRDAGESWSTITRWNHDESWLKARTFPGEEIVTRDVIVTGDDIVFVSTGFDDPARRSADGEWSITQSGIQPFAGLEFVSFVLIAVNCFFCVRRFRGAARGFGFTHAIGVLLSGLVLGLAMQEQGGIGPLGAAAGTFIGAVITLLVWTLYALRNPSQASSDRDDYVRAPLLEIGVSVALAALLTLGFIGFDLALLPWRVVLGFAAAVALPLAGIAALLAPLEAVLPPPPPTGTDTAAG